MEFGSSMSSNPSCSDASTNTIRPSRSLTSNAQAHTFCDCYQSHRGDQCRCGEENSTHDWTWDDASKSPSCQVSGEEVLFHMDYSCGTAAVRGNKPLNEGQHFWEIKMVAPVYGTDMMIGVGTSDVKLDKYRYNFTSLLGRDADSWGMSYTGQRQHAGTLAWYGERFGQGSIVGVYLDTWHGTLTFFNNRQPLGIAYRNLNKCKEFYPMVSSTAARSCMRLVRSCSFRTSLQFMCCQTLRKLIPRDRSVLEAVSLPPGLHNFLRNNLGWLLSSSSGGISCEENLDGERPSCAVCHSPHCMSRAKLDKPSSSKQAAAASCSSCSNEQSLRRRIRRVGESSGCSSTAPDRTQKRSKPDTSSDEGSSRDSAGPSRKSRRLVNKK